MGLRMLGPAYFARPLTHQSAKHLRLDETLTEQRPLRPACPKLCPKPCRDNGGTDCRAVCARCPRPPLRWTRNGGQKKEVNFFRYGKQI